MKNEKKSNNNNKYFFTLTFLYRRNYILLGNTFGKTQFILLHLFDSFLTWQIIGNTVRKHQYPLRYELVSQTPCVGCIFRQIQIAIDRSRQQWIIFSFFISEKYPQFRKKQTHLLETIFRSLHTSNRIYLLRNCFSNYVYLKDMYITSKGIRKTLFILVLRIFLICKLLNFTAVFTKKKY